MSRRGFMRATAATAGGAAVGSTATVPRFSPVGRADAAAPLVVAGALVGIHYLLEEGAEMLGDERDYSGYTGGDALHTEIEVGVTEMQSADERVMTSIENNIQHSDNVALAKGKTAIIEAMNAEKSESEAQTAMQSAIDDYFATIEENVLNHYVAQLSQMRHMADRVESHGDVSLEDVFEVYTSDWWQPATGAAATGGDDDAYTVITGKEYGEDYEAQTQDWDLLNGETFTGIETVQYTSTYEQGDLIPHSSMGGGHGFVRFRVQPMQKESTTEFFELSRFDSAIDSILSQRDSVNATLSGFVSDVYAQWEPGEIPTEELVDPVTAATELRQNYDGMQGQGAFASMLGIPTDADFSVRMTLEDDDVKVWADIYTEHVPTNSEGEEVGFQSGETYQPSTWDAPLYIAYEFEETSSGDGSNNSTSTTTTTGSSIQSDFVQIEQNFTIEFVEDADGNEVTEFQTESRNNQTSDVSALEEELAQIREEQIRLQEEAEEEAASGGGFFDDIGGESAGVLVVAVLAALALLSR